MVTQLCKYAVNQEQGPCSYSALLPVGSLFCTRACQFSHVNMWALLKHGGHRACWNSLPGNSVIGAFGLTTLHSHWKTVKSERVSTRKKLRPNMRMRRQGREERRRPGKWTGTDIPGGRLWRAPRSGTKLWAFVNWNFWFSWKPT